MEKLTADQVFYLGWNLGHVPENPWQDRQYWECVCGASFSDTFTNHVMRYGYKFLREHGRHKVEPRYLAVPNIKQVIRGTFTPIPAPAKPRPRFRKKLAERSEAPRGRPAAPGVTDRSVTTTRHTPEERATYRAARIRAREGDPL